MGERAAHSAQGGSTDAPEPPASGEATPPVESSVRSRGRPNAATYGFGAAVTAFLVVQLWEIWSARPSKNVGDVALIEMETRRVFTTTPPLLGAYSRYGWRHPGALLFWLWSPVYELFGRSSKSLSSAAAILVVCCLLWLWVAIARESTAIAVVGAGASLLMIATVGESGIASAWNVTATLVPFLVVVLGAGVAATAREPLALAIWMIAWWLFVFESHVGTGVVAFPVVVAMVAALAVRRLRRPFALQFAVPERIATGAVAVAALPLVVDVVAHRGGNLRAILGWARGDGPEAAGFGTAWRIVGRATSLSFLSSPAAPHVTFPVLPDWGVLPGTLAVVFAVACAVAVQGSRRRWGVVLAALGIAWLSALVAVARIPVPVYFWLVAWLQPLGWLTWVVCIYVAGRELYDRGSVGRRERRAVGRRPDRAASGRSAGVVALVGALIGVTVAVGSGPPTLPTDRSERQVSELSAALGPELGAAPTMLDAGENDISGAVMVAGILNDLDRQGASVCAGPLWGFRLTQPWQCDARRQPGSTVLVRAESAAMPPPAGTTLLAISDYLSVDQRRDVDEASARLRTFLEDRGRPDLAERVDTVFVSTVLDADGVGRADSAVVDDVALLDRVARLRGRRYGLYLVTGRADEPPQ